LFDSSFKNPKCKEQEKFKAEAYLVIREGLNFLQRRSNWEFFNAVKLGDHPSLHCIVSLEPTNFYPEHIDGLGCILPEESGKQSPKACCNEPEAITYSWPKTDMDK
jgi:hypothetical protein